MKLIALALLCAPLFGQGAKLKIDLDHLAAKAEKVVNVNLDGSMLDAGRKMLSEKKGAADPQVKQLIDGLQGVYVRTFEFAAPGAYSSADVEKIRSQLSGPGWVSFVDVNDRKRGETVAVYSYMEGGKMAGMAVVAAEPKELTVVNIVGPVDLSTLGQLKGFMGIPDMKSVMKPVAGSTKNPTNAP